LVGLERQLLFNVINSALAILRGFAVIGILIWVSPTIQAFFIWQVIISAAAILLFAITTYTSIPKSLKKARFSISSIMQIRSFAKGMIILTTLSLLLTQIDKVMLIKFLPLSDYGYYALASVVSSSIFMFVFPVAQAVFPKLTMLYNKKDKQTFLRIFHKASQLINVTVGSSSFVLIFFASLFLQTWTQDYQTVENTSSLLKVITIGNLFNVLTWMPGQVQLASGRTEIAIKNSQIAILLIVPLILFAVPSYGAIGGAFAWLSLNIMYLLLCSITMFKDILLNEKNNWYLNDIFKPLLGAFFTSFILSKFILASGDRFTDMLLLGLAFFITLTISALCSDEIRKQILKYYLSRRDSLKYK
jgi:O-antigen/teichoic acid export membrane protein